MILAGFLTGGDTTVANTIFYLMCIKADKSHGCLIRIRSSGAGGEAIRPAIAPSTHENLVLSMFP